MPFLIVRQPGQVAFSFPLRGGITLGRSEDNDLVLWDNRVSRHHCQIAPENGGWILVDLGSTHGTLVGRARVERHTLRDGDQLQLGDALLSFALEDVGSEIVHHQPTGDAAPKQRGKTDRRTQVLREIGSAIGAAGDPDELLGRMLESVLDVLGCERAVVGLREPEGKLRQVVRAQSAASRSEVVLKRDFLDELLDRREALILREGGKGSAPRRLAPERGYAMGAPLSLGRHVLGFLYVEDRRQSERFTPEDLDFLVALGHLAAAALNSVERLQRATAVAEATVAGVVMRELLGDSEPMKRLRTAVQKFGNSTARVLIRGETGTGKELIARALHAASPKSEHPLVTVNCAAIPETLIESELFGHEQGAFTGAAKRHRGKFELAHRGTLFLDEIGDLSLAAQAKVLRAIQEGEIQPLGTERTMRVDVRLLAATHKDLSREMAEGRFREDLYYRLNVVEIVAPALRDRIEDVEVLAQALLTSEAAGTGKNLKGFTRAAIAAMLRYGWPGNVRELRNEVERAVIHAESSWIDVADLSPRVQVVAGKPPEPPPNAGATGWQSFAERYKALETAQGELIKEALKAAQGNLSEASRLLGITWTMMKRRAKRLEQDGRS